MTQEAYVSFEVAKLLIEKGFEIDTSKDYWKIGEDGTMYFMSSIGAYTSDVNNKFAFYRPADTYPCPTQQMAMRWLREEHKINIEVRMLFDSWDYCIQRIPNHEGAIYQAEDIWKSYEAACNAALYYCLDNLIETDADEQA